MNDYELLKTAIRIFLNDLDRSKEKFRIAKRTKPVFGVKDISENPDYNMEYTDTFKFSMVADDIFQLFEGYLIKAESMDSRPLFASISETMHKHMSKTSEDYFRKVLMGDLIGSDFPHATRMEGLNAENYERRNFNKNPPPPPKTVTKEIPDIKLTYISETVKKEPISEISPIKFIE